MKLPKKAEDIVSKIGKYAGNRGKLLLASEIVEDKDGNCYLIDVNTTPGIGSVACTEFPYRAQPDESQIFNKAAKMIINIIKN